MALDASEVMTLIIVLFGYFSVMFTHREHPKAQWVFYGYTALLLGSMATVLNDIFFPGELTLLAHAIGVTGGGIFFLLWAYEHYKEDRFLRRKLEEMERAGE